ncbi:hypothetical protein MKEN_00155100 [Mycena kentingensis (nom. inval.)]|nr:hypothetical protein MKEN_00155100 [Mycena kentingensis (nom. inval.)]
MSTHWNGRPVPIDFSFFKLPDAPPTLSALAVSNRVPNDAEAKILAEYRKECAEKLADLDYAMRTLGGLREDGQCQLRGHQNAFSAHAVRKIPRDLLGEIAMHVVDVDGRVVPPWQMASVCASWREALVGYASLWTTIETRNRRQVKLQLRRSGRALISVRIVPRKELDQCLDLLVRYSHRWKLLHIGRTDGAIFGKEATAALLRTHGKLNELVELVAIDWNPSSVEYPNAPGDLFLRAPRLRRVSLFHAQIRVPWRQLTHYTAFETVDHVLCKILRRSPNLVHLAFSTEYREPEEQFQPVTLSELQTLCLWGGSTAVEYALDAITAPSLKRLCVAPDTLLSCVELGDTSTFDGAEVNSFLRLCPNLEYLALYRGSGDDVYVSSRGTMDNSGYPEIDEIIADVLCPNLTQLVFAMRTYASFREMREEGNNKAATKMKHEFQRAFTSLVWSRSDLRVRLSTRDGALRDCNTHQATIVSQGRSHAPKCARGEASQRCCLSVPGGAMKEWTSRIRTLSSTFGSL